MDGRRGCVESGRERGGWSYDRGWVFQQLRISTWGRGGGEGRLGCSSDLICTSTLLRATDMILRHFAPDFV